MMPKSTRMYGLFEVGCLPNGRKKYIRLFPELPYPKQVAVARFQDQLLAYAFGYTDKPRELRPIK